MCIKRTCKNSFNSFTVAVKPLKIKAFRGEKTGGETFTREKILSPHPPASPQRQATGHRRRSFLSPRMEKTILGKEPNP